MSPEKVLVTRADHVLASTINRPESRNGVDSEACALISGAVEASHDPNIGCSLVTGAGEASFCAGADRRAIARGERMLPEGMEQWSYASFARRFTCRPTIAAVTGTALGGGFKLTMAYNLVVASETATFGLPEVKRGLLADVPFGSRTICTERSPSSWPTGRSPGGSGQADGDVRVREVGGLSYEHDIAQRSERRS